MPKVLKVLRAAFAQRRCSAPEARPENMLGIALGRVHTDLERLLSLVRRELGAVEARLLATGEPSGDDPLSLVCRLPDGRGVLVRFEELPPDLEARQRRLEMLASTFDTMVEDSVGSKRGRPISLSLHDELVALCARASAANAIVIDANSPVVWGAAFPEGVVAQTPLTSSPRMVEAPANDEGLLEDSRVVASRRAIHAVRGWPELGALRKGKHVRKLELGDEGTPLVAHSFASIYLLVLVFDASFDELRAERAVVEAIPRVERLVLALPPLDPEPEPFERAGVIALRRSSRKR